MDETSNRSAGVYNQCSMDVINNLHDSILTNILSRLTAEDAVRTSILSKDWRYKWTLIHTVNINNSPLTGQNREMEPVFVDFVDKVLLRWQNATRFNLSLGGRYGLSHVADWLSYIFSETRVQSIRVYCSKDGTVLPSQYLLDCTELRELHLDWPCMLHFRAMSFFPNLVDLQLELVRIVNEDFECDTMILKFPVLVSLRLEACTWLNMEVVDINAPSLTSFNCESRYFTYRRIDEYSIRIIGEKLTKFCSSGGLPEDYIISNSSTVVSATFSNRFGGQDVSESLLRETGLKARRLFKGMSNLEDLMISGCMVKAIMQLNRELPHSKYDKLQRLILCLHNTTRWRTEAVCDLLHAAPSLKFLTIDGIGWTGYDYDDELEPVPSCIMHHLEEVKFKYYKAYRANRPLHIEKFLLENASQMWKFYISGYDCVRKTEILEKLSSFISETSTCLLSVAFN